MNPFRQFMNNRKSLLGIDHDRWDIDFCTRMITDAASEQLTDFAIDWCEARGLGIVCGYGIKNERQMEFGCVLYPLEPRKRLTKKHAVQLFAAIRRHGALTGVRATGKVGRRREPPRAFPAAGAF